MLLGAASVTPGLSLCTAALCPSSVGAQTNQLPSSWCSPTALLFQRSSTTTFLFHADQQRVEQPGAGPRSCRHDRPHRPHAAQRGAPRQRHRAAAGKGGRAPCPTCSLGAVDLGGAAPRQGQFANRDAGSTLTTAWPSSPLHPPTWPLQHFNYLPGLRSLDAHFWCGGFLPAFSRLEGAHDAAGRPVVLHELTNRHWKIERELPAE